jgi:hypothetical protein
MAQVKPQAGPVLAEHDQWVYGPNGQSRLIQQGEELPKGWADHPDKVKGGAQ